MKKNILIALYLIIISITSIIFASCTPLRPEKYYEDWAESENYYISSAVGNSLFAYGIEGDNYYLLEDGIEHYYIKNQNGYTDYSCDANSNNTTDEWYYSDIAATDPKIIEIQKNAKTTKTSVKSVLSPLFSGFDNKFIKENGKWTYSETTVTLKSGKLTISSIFGTKILITDYHVKLPANMKYGKKNNETKPTTALSSGIILQFFSLSQGCA